MSFEVNQHVGTFGRNLGNGVAALENTVQAIEHVSQSNHRDTTVIVRMIERAEEKKDPDAARRVKFLFNQVFPGARSGKDKNKRPTIKIKDIQPDDEAREKLANLLADGVSIRSPKVRKAFVGDAETKKREADSVAKSAIRTAKKNGVSKKQMLAMVETLWNEVKLDN